MADVIEKLKQTRWWKPAVKKFASYLIAHKRQECEGASVSFDSFVNDILVTPEHLCDELLEIEDTPEALEFARLQNAPSVHYRQYDGPTRKELTISLTLRQQKKKKKRGR
jgi:hypothetical protein